MTVQTTSGVRGAFQRAPLTWFFILAYGLSRLAWAPYILSENGLGVWHRDFGAGGSGQILGVLPGAYLGPICVALLITSLTEGRQGLRNWRARMTKLRVGGRWYLLVLVSVPAALTLATVAMTDTEPALPGCQPSPGAVWATWPSRPCGARSRYRAVSLPLRRPALSPPRMPRGPVQVGVALRERRGWSAPGARGG